MYKQLPQNVVFSLVGTTHSEPCGRHVLYACLFVTYINNIVSLFVDRIEECGELNANVVGTFHLGIQVRVDKCYSAIEL